MDMTNKEYGQYVNAKSQPSHVGKNCLWAFFVGGIICTLGQCLLNFYQGPCGLEKEDAAAAVDEFFDAGPSDKVLILSVAFPGEDAYSVQLWYRDGKAVCSFNEDGIEVRSLDDLLAYFRV